MVQIIIKIENFLWQEIFLTENGFLKQNLNNNCIKKSVIGINVKMIKKEFLRKSQFL
jgi:hypothetical protein